MLSVKAIQSKIDACENQRLYAFNFSNVRNMSIVFLKINEFF